MLFDFASLGPGSAEHKMQLNAIFQYGRPQAQRSGTVIDGRTWEVRGENGKIIVDKQGRPGWLRFPPMLERQIQFIPPGRVSSQFPTLQQAYAALTRLQADPDWAELATEAKAELARDIGPDPNVVVAPPPTAPAPPFLPTPPDLASRFPPFLVAQVEQRGVYATLQSLTAMAERADTPTMAEHYAAWYEALEAESLAWLAQCG